MASMPEVQRLRRLKQLGVGEQTFPTANHTRFEHSLGVAALAKRLGHHLAKQQPELGISSTDLMTLELAGRYCFRPT
jgi:HD superfamily phosphohydrolase